MSMFNHLRLLYSSILLCFTCLPAVSATIEIVSPLDYQVYQRHSRLRGTVRIEGKMDTDGDVQFRFSGKPLEGKMPSDWQPLNVDLKKHCFCINTTVPAGGWYRLDVRLINGDKTLAESSIAHVGVGEVFIVAGQSNSASYGEGRQKPATDRVVSFDKSRWAVANDPQRGADGQGGSFIPAFGDAMIKKYNVPIGLVCVGAGGTSVREWLPKGHPVAAPPTTGANVISTGPNTWVAAGRLYDFLSSRINRLGTHGFRAILWHQGESDAKQPPGRNITPQQYRQYLQHLIKETRDKAGWKIPWFVAQVSYHTPDDPGTPELRAAQKSLATDGTAIAGPNTDELGSEFRDHGGKGTHFNARGLRRHGELWAKFVAPWLDRELAAKK